MSFSACLMQEGYSLIEKDDLVNRLQFARHQPVVYSIIRSMYHQFLSGNIRLVQKSTDTALDTPFALDISKGIEEWFWESLLHILMLGISICSVFEGRVRTIEQYQQSFAPHQENKRKRSDEEEEGEGGEDQEKPNYYISRVMNIEELDVYVITNIYNKNDYKCIYHQVVNGQVIEVEVLDLCILEYEKPTIRDGMVQLNSLYNRIYPDYCLQQHNLMCHAQSTILSSNPMLLLQDNPQKKDPDMAAADSVKDIFNTNVSLITQQSNNNSALAETKAVHTGYGYELMQAKRELMHKRAEERKAQPRVILTPSVGAETQIGYLPYNRVLAKQNMPIPVPYLIECDGLFQSRIYTALCIPMGIQFDINPTSNNKAQAMGKLNTAGQDGTSSKSTSYELYNNTLRYIRSFLLREIQSILDMKTEKMRTKMSRTISDTYENWYGESVQFDPGNLQIVIEMPGLRKDEDVWSLYKIGKLEEDAFDSHFINNGFHERDLKEKAELDVKEMNGVVDPPEKEGAPKKKKNK